MKRTITQKIKDLFSEDFLEKVLETVSEKPEKVHNCIKMSLPVLLLAFIYMQRSQKNYIFNNYTSSTDLQNGDKNEISSYDQTEIAFIQSNINLYDDFNKLFGGRFHSLIDYMGAYFGIKSLSVQIILNSIFLGTLSIFEDLNEQAEKKFWRSKKLKKEEKLLRKAIPNSFNLIYIFGK